MKKLAAVFSIIALALFGAISPAGAACWEWSHTASANATADPSINWSEGMAPSAVNDSARAMMARLAECRDDISGALHSTGTGAAYVVTTNQGLDSPPVDGQMIAFIPIATNEVNATLKTDGGTAYPLVTSSASVGIAAGVMAEGTPYRVTFNASASAWVLNSVFGSPFQIPLGGLMASTVDTPPNSSFVLPAGQCISRTVYADYFAAVGTRFGTCDGTTTFAVIDMRGRLPAGIDNLNGTAANRVTSASNGCGVAFTSVGVACGAENVTMIGANVAQHNHPIFLHDPGHQHTYSRAINAGIQMQQGGFSMFYTYDTQLTSVATTGITLWSDGDNVGTQNKTGLNGTATPTPMRSLPPIIGVTYFLRIK